jgi:Holliday junction resolvasome RuvABC endonuclease subunit
MIVMGIDGGMVRLGLAAVRPIDNGEELITHGLIYHPRGSEPFNEYLETGIIQIVDSFPRFIDLVRPDLIVSEYIPAGKLGSSDSQVIAAVTTCRVIAYQFGIDWKNIGANTVKKELTGDYRASKTLVRNTVLDLFPTVAQRHQEMKLEQKAAGDKKRPGLPQDVFDALAVAVVGTRLYCGDYEQKEEMPELQEA